METLKDKINKYFDGKVVRKDLPIKIKGNLPVPTYVLEYLLGQQCAGDDERIIEEGVEKVKSIIKNNYVNRSDAEFVKSKIRETGNYKIIDKINVELNDRKNIYQAEFANLGVKNVRVSDNIVKDNPKLLSGGGVWCIITMSYDHSDTNEVRWQLVDLRPIQVSNVDVKEFIELRKEFTSEEWIDLLMHSIGLNPDSFSRRDKLIQLSRLIPHAENNFNFIELGPKGTGKSHVFSEFSPNGVLVSGGDVTSARLFVNNSNNKLGLIGYWDVVAWDEFEHQLGKKVDPKMIDSMQNYLANQSFNRGKETYQATASMAFVGNTKHTVPFMLKNTHLFESIPDSFIKGAFLDRVHLYIPGWEVRILKKAAFSGSLGFIVDYFAEILHQLRKLDYSNILDQYAALDGSLTQRDQNGIRKTFSGLVKIIFPDRVLTDAEAFELIDFAIEGRKRVKEQLYIIDDTFRHEPAKFKYTNKISGKEIDVETLERINYGYSDIQKLEENIVEEDNVSQSLLHKPTDITVHKKPALQPKTITIRDNQSGISYKKLFADYLIGSNSIVLTDPYIRLPYQFNNFVEFCVMLSQLKQADEEVNLHVITWNTEDRTPDSIDNFDEIAGDVAELGLNLTYEFKDLHDRNIVSDNGWKIVLGRGLDIFNPREGRFNAASILQEKRTCKNCEIFYLKSNIND